MAVHCPVCKSPDVQHTITGYQCLAGGHLFNAEMKPLDPGPDASTRAVLEYQLAPKATVMVGNFADLQRMGAQAANTTGSNQAEEFVQPPAFNPITPAEQDRRSLALAEAINGPANPKPRDNPAPDPVDPTSQSPTPRASSPSPSTSKK